MSQRWRPSSLTFYLMKSSRLWLNTLAVVASVAWNRFCCACRSVTTVAMSALAREESRGAHQREDFPGMLPQWRLNQVARLDGASLTLTPAAAVAEAAAQ